MGVLNVSALTAVLQCVAMNEDWPNTNSLSDVALKCDRNFGIEHHATHHQVITVEGVVTSGYLRSISSIL